MAGLGATAKARMVDELVTELKRHPHLIVTSFGKLSVAESDALRKQLRGLQAEYFVAKHAICRKALASLGVEGLMSFLEGPVGLVLAKDDPARVSKALVDFAKERAEAFWVRGGMVEGQCVPSQGIEALAQLPPKEQLLAELVFTLELPLQHLTQTIEELLRGVVFVIEGLGKQRENT